MSSVDVVSVIEMTRHVADSMIRTIALIIQMMFFVISKMISTLLFRGRETHAVELRSVRRPLRMAVAANHASQPPANSPIPLVHHALYALLRTFWMLNKQILLHAGTALIAMQIAVLMLQLA